MGPLRHLVLLALTSAAPVKKPEFTTTASHQVVVRFNAASLPALEAIRAFSETEAVLFDYWSPLALDAPFDVRMEASQATALIRSLAGLDATASILIPDLHLLLATEKSGRANPLARSWEPAVYHSYDQIVDYFQNSAVPDASRIASTFSIGTTHEGRDLRVVRITGGNKSTSADGMPTHNGLPAVWMMSLLHAREHLTGAAMSVIVDRLLKTYRTDPSATRLVDQFDLFFLLVANPDGYEYSRNSDRWWRKNRRPNAGSSCVGTDLNRNFAHRAWGDTSGSSSDPCSDIYHGAGAGSESEVAAIQRFITEFGTGADGSSHFKLFIDHHTYSQMWLYPWGFKYDAAPHSAEHYALCEAAVEAMRQVHGKTFTFGPAASTIYVTTGDSTDWAYDPLPSSSPESPGFIKHVFTIEGRDMGNFGFVAPASEILPAAEELFAGLNAALLAVAPSDLPPTPPKPPAPPPAASPPPSPPKPPPAPATCVDSPGCPHLNDGDCDDGGPGSDYDICDYGTDCSDCGPRPPLGAPPGVSTPPPPPSPQQSASPPPPPPPSQQRQPHWVNCGRSGRCDEDGKWAEPAERHEVRCCSDSDLGNDWRKNPGCSVWAESDAQSMGGCNSRKTLLEAEAICSDAGVRLCTAEELQSDCSKSTGCGFDKELVWSSDS